MNTATAGSTAGEQRRTVAKHRLGAKGGVVRGDMSLPLGCNAAEGRHGVEATGLNATVEEDDEDQEDGDQFEVDGSTITANRHTVTRAGRGLKVSSTGCGGSARLVAVGEGCTAITTVTPAAVPHIEVNRGWDQTTAAALVGRRVAGRDEVPDALKNGVGTCLDEACDAFRKSIRRAVLNYVLLDAGQRHRLGAFLEVTRDRRPCSTLQAFRAYHRSVVH